MSSFYMLPPPDFPLPAYVRRVESGLLVPRQAVLPGLVMPPGLMSSDRPLTSIEYLASSENFTIPAITQAGDLLVGSRARGFGDFVTPSGFTTGASGSYAGMFYKIATADDAGASYDHNQEGDVDLLLVFRGNSPVKSVSKGGGNVQITTGNPSPQTIPSGSGTPPLIAIASYFSFYTVDPRSMSPGKDGEAHTADNRMWIAWKTFDASTSPVNVTVDMDDEGNSPNILMSLYLQLA